MSCSFEFDGKEISIYELQKFTKQEFIQLEPRDIKFYNSVCLIGSKRLVMYNTGI